MLITRSSPVETAQSVPAMPTGIDTGAGLVKMAIAGTRVRIPSKVVQVTDLEDDLRSSDGGYFFYQDGDRADLIGINPVPEGCWANALGLERIATGRLARGK